MMKLNPRIRRFGASHLLAAGAVVITLTAMAACGSPSEPAETPVGTFNLRSVDGDRLPAMAGHPGDPPRRITRGDIVFARDGSCSASFTFEPLPSEGTSPLMRFDHCTWEHIGSQVRMKWAVRGEETGALTRNELLLPTSDGRMWGLERRVGPIRGLTGGSGTSGGNH